MGAMSSCIGGMNSHHAREVQFNLISPPSFSLQDRRKQFRLKQKSNSQIFVPIENDMELNSNQEEINSDKNSNNLQIMENKINTNINNNTNKEIVDTFKNSIRNKYKRRRNKL